MFCSATWSPQYPPLPTPRDRQPQQEVAGVGLAWQGDTIILVMVDIWLKIRLDRLIGALRLAIVCEWNTVDMRRFTPPARNTCQGLT